MHGKARDPRVELRIAEAARASEVDGRDLVRRAAAEMGDPVVIANGQILLPIFSGSCAAPLLDGISLAGEGSYGMLSCVEWLGEGWGAVRFGAACTGGYSVAISRRVAPEVCSKLFALSKKRAQGMPDARCTRGLMCNGERSAHMSIQGSGEHPTSPAQWLYGL